MKTERRLKGVVFMLSNNLFLRKTNFDSIFSKFTVQDITFVTQMHDSSDLFQAKIKIMQGFL